MTTDSVTLQQAMADAGTGDVRAFLLACHTLERAAPGIRRAFNPSDLPSATCGTLVQTARPSKQCMCTGVHHTRRTPSTRCPVARRVGITSGFTWLTDRSRLRGIATCESSVSLNALSVSLGCADVGNPVGPSQVPAVSAQSLGHRRPSASRCRRVLQVAHARDRTPPELALGRIRLRSLLALQRERSCCGCHPSADVGSWSERPSCNTCARGFKVYCKQDASNGQAGVDSLPCQPDAPGDD